MSGQGGDGEGHSWLSQNKIIVYGSEEKHETDKEVTVCQNSGEDTTGQKRFLCSFNQGS